MLTTFSVFSPKRQIGFTLKPQLSRVRAILLLLLRSFQVEGYEHRLLDMQKFAYLLQEIGEPLDLSFRKHTYGPHSEDLDFILKRLEGRYLRGSNDRSLSVALRLLPGAVEDSERILGDENAALNSRMERLHDLLCGYETAYGIELLATVHWVMRKSMLALVDENVAVRGVHAWGGRQGRMFKVAHIRQARSRLCEQGWFSGNYSQATPATPLGTGVDPE
ncbi:MAG TPA: hypothetical protein VGZ00_09500 [Candidatus Baltobacteraceae bacterium]|nr:hypothetical protein [Candidatus Baltobacteraceae bacterium]